MQDQLLPMKIERPVAVSTEHERILQEPNRTLFAERGVVFEELMRKNEANFHFHRKFGRLAILSNDYFHPNATRASVGSPPNGLDHCKAAKFTGALFVRYAIVAP